MDLREAASMVRPAVEYLSDLKSSLFPINRCWGEVGFDASWSTLDREGPLQVGGRKYSKGLGMRAPGDLYVELNGEYDCFEAEIGVEPTRGKDECAIFRVIVDGEERFVSGEIWPADDAMQISVPLNGARELQLSCDPTDGFGVACDWCEARLVRSQTPRLCIPQEQLDIAVFAEVVTCDPSRMDGAKCSRSEEFPGKDVFLETDLIKESDGCYQIGPYPNGECCIGLKWFERRRLTRLELEFEDNTLPADDIRIEYWDGVTLWQGEWKPLNGSFVSDGNTIRFVVEWHEAEHVWKGIRKVRWVFPSTGSKIRDVRAYTRSSWSFADLSVQLEHPVAGQVALISAYNGRLASTSPAGSLLSEQAWDVRSPMGLRVLWSLPSPFKLDRTLLTFRLVSGTFTVAVEDVLAHGCVYVKSAGLFVAAEPEAISIDEYKTQMLNKQTTLAQVRNMPDQTFAQAMERIHNPVQDNGPLMISLYCHNAKYIVQCEGDLSFETEYVPPQDSPKRYRREVVPRFGHGDCGRFRRELVNGWMPIPVSTVSCDGVTYSQTTYVAPLTPGIADGSTDCLSQRCVCVAEYAMGNPSPDAKTASVELSFFTDNKNAKFAEVRQLSGGVVALESERVMAYLCCPSDDLTVAIGDGQASVKADVSAGSCSRFFLFVPSWDMSEEEYNSLARRSDLKALAEEHWRDVMSRATGIEVPDPLLQNVINASQVHCLLASRNEENGSLIAPWVSSTTYGAIDSECHSVIRGMDRLGHNDFARRALDRFISLYNEQGFLTTGYTVYGTGLHLWTVAEHFDITRDVDWLKKVAPELVRVCKWIIRQREKTRRLDAKGEKVPEYGLMPPGLIADWAAYSYSFFLNGCYWAGLSRVGRVLETIDHPDAREIMENAEEFRQEILRAYRWAQANAPVVRLDDGTWIPSYPTQLHCRGPIKDFFPNEDGGRCWAYDVEVGVHHLVPQGLLAADGEDSQWIMDHMEDVQFQTSGWNDYSASDVKADWFNLGGFSKIQPYYTRAAEIYALRDDIKPFIRSYFNAVSTLLNTEVLWLWEHFYNEGGWNKTHETGYFLQQTRMMLAVERGDELWLAPFVTNNWMQHGMSVALSNAPSTFGTLSYRITSHVNDGYIEAHVDPPARSKPSKLVLRLRHPENAPMKRIFINGKPSASFDPDAETITLQPGQERLCIRAEY